LGEDALRGSRGLVERMRDWTQHQYANLLTRARRTGEDISASPRRWSFIGILLAALLLLGINARGWLRWMRERRLKTHPEEAPSLAATLWYERTIRWLGRHGWKKTAVQTPKEFLRRIEDPAMRERVEKFTRAYEAARFGESPEEARRLPALYEEITTPDRR
jgi:hypothetical protein